MRGLERFVVTGRRWRQATQAVKDEGVGKVRCDCGQALRHFAFCPAGPHNAHPAREGPGKQIHVIR